MTNIIPISSKIEGLGSVGGGPNISQAGNAEEKNFSDYFKDAIGEIDTLNAIKDQDAYNLAIGEVDDLAQIGINASKAEMSVQLMVQIRNKLLDSYSEIMRISV